MTNEHQKLAVRLIDSWTTPHTSALAAAGLVSPIRELSEALASGHRGHLAIAAATLRTALRNTSDPLALDIGSRVLAETEHVARSL
ncbi:MAG: hypothetical protein IT182_02090 [Acidobacteria bacterium]|nr:hypothetical protein [Acidobacteriota bacterium]